MFIVVKCNSQIEYYDAIKLRSAIRWFYTWSVQCTDPACVFAPTLLLQSTSPYPDGYSPKDTIIEGKHIKFIKINSVKIGFSTNSESFDQVKSILGFYSSNPSETDFSKIRAEYTNNDFIFPYIRDGNTAGGGTPVSLFTSSLSSIGNSDVTSFADGFAKFIANRTKEEIDIVFFQNFHHFLNMHPDIKQLFPNTEAFLEKMYTYEVPNILPMLQTAFTSDLKSFLGNIASVADLPDTVCNCNNTTAQKTKCKNRLKTIQSFFNTEYGRTVMAALIISDGAINKKNPADILTALVGNKTIAAMASSTNRVDNDIINSLRLVNILSESIRSENANEVWVSQSELNALLADETLRNIFIGLVYQQIKNAQISIAGHNVGGLIQSAVDIRPYFTNLFTDINKIETDYKAWRKDRLIDSTPSQILTHATVYLDDIEKLIGDGLNNKKVISTWPDISNKTEFIFSTIDTTMIIAKMILDKNYYGAILATSTLLDDIMQTRKDMNGKGQIIDKDRVAFRSELKSSSLHEHNISLKFKGKSVEQSTNFAYASGILTIDGKTLHAPNNLAAALEVVKNNEPAIKEAVEKYVKQSDDIVLWKKQYLRDIIKYGGFISSVANAKNSDEVEKAISSVALPAGSASIKKTTNVNICIQAYAGGSYAHPSDGTQFAAYAPLGFAFSYGLKNHYNPFVKRSYGSITLFAQVVDLGAVVAYRFKEPNTKLSDSLKITFNNIFAPGASLVYGIPKYPISIGGGVKWQPELGSLDANKAVLTKSSGFLWHAFIAFDLPMVNIYSSKK